MRKEKKNFYEQFRKQISYCNYKMYRTIGGNSKQQLTPKYCVSIKAQTTNIRLGVKSSTGKTGIPRKVYIHTVPTLFTARWSVD